MRTQRAQGVCVIIRACMVTAILTFPSAIQSNSPFKNNISPSNHLQCQNMNKWTQIQSDVHQIKAQILKTFSISLKISTWNFFSFYKAST